MTDQELEAISLRLAGIVLAAMANNIRCFRCGWIGPEGKLYPSGSLGRKTCPQCHDGYHWDRADAGGWFTQADSLITCDSATGCGDGTFYCSRRVVWMEAQKPPTRLPEETKPKPSWWKLWRKG